MKIGILGAGIAGLSTAISLKLAGFDVDLYERHSAVQEIGAGIVCWPNASFVLEQIGVLDQLAKKSGHLSKMKRFSSTGETLGVLDIQRLSELMKYPSYSIIRKDLMNILIERATALGINIYYDYRVTKITTSDSGLAKVHFSNDKTIFPDIVIGADGRMNSLARKYVNGNNKPVYQKFINWIGVFESQDELFTELSVADYWGMGERFGIVPVSKTKAYWAGGVHSEMVCEREPDKYRDELKIIFDEWPSNIPRIIRDTPLLSINKIYVHDHDPINVWHKNNLLVLGDAAHSPLPTSGQGACQALEDAWHITKCLTKDSQDITQVFNQFTEIRKSKTSGITMGGRQLASSIFNSDLEYCRQRNIAAKEIDYVASVSDMAKGWSSNLPISEI